jgi:septal ring factor EnvC (AmiA/AmiB activator)
VNSHGDYSNKRDDNIKQNANDISELRELVGQNCNNIKKIQKSIEELNDTNHTLTKSMLEIQSKIIQIDKHQRNGLKDEIVTKIIESMDEMVKGQNTTISNALSSSYKHGSDRLKYNAYEKGSVEETKRTKWTVVSKIIMNLIAPGALIWLIIDKILT